MYESPTEQSSLAQNRFSVLPSRPLRDLEPLPDIMVVRPSLICRIPNTRTH